MQAWVAHEGRASQKAESALYAYDVEVRGLEGRTDAVEFGTGNGGGRDVLAGVLPPGSTVLGVGDEFTADVQCDVGDVVALRAALGGRRYGLLIDATWRDADALCGTLRAAWPHLAPSGIYLLETPPAAPQDRMEALLLALAALAWTVNYDTTGATRDWPLPHEEVLRVTFYAGVVAIQKRHARVLPYMNLVAGKEFPHTSTAALSEQGAVLVTP
jgi:hypothetical protein